MLWVRTAWSMVVRLSNKSWTYLCVHVYFEGELLKMWFWLAWSYQWVDLNFVSSFAEALVGCWCSTAPSVARFTWGDSDALAVWGCCKGWGALCCAHMDASMWGHGGTPVLSCQSGERQEGRQLHAACWAPDMGTARWRRESRCSRFRAEVCVWVFCLWRDRCCLWTAECFWRELCCLCSSSAFWCVNTLSETRISYGSGGRPCLLCVPYSEGQ